MAPIAPISIIRWLWPLLALLVAMTARAGLLDDMVVLERVYVPVLALTNQPGKQAESTAALQRFERAWTAFRGADAVRADRSLASVLDGAEPHIAKARREIVAGNLKEAHEALEHLRHALWHWRTGKGIDYFPDRLTAYHDQMELLADAATHAAERGKFTTALQQARARWADVTKSKFDASLHGFDAAKQGRMSMLMAREGEALARLEQLGAGGDAAALAAEAKTLKGTFAQIYFLFGDFPAPGN